MSNIRGFGDIKNDNKEKQKNQRPKVQMPKIDNKKVIEIKGTQEFDKYIQKIRSTNQLVKFK